MTKTEHFNLCTWAPEDFVDLDQVNENFTLLDAALAARQIAAFARCTMRRVHSSIRQT